MEISCQPRKFFLVRGPVPFPAGRKRSGKLLRSGEKGPGPPAMREVRAGSLGCACSLEEGRWKTMRKGKRPVRTGFFG